MHVPKISVIMPVFNCEKYLDESINSILNQTYRDFEFFIINDGSTDNSEKIIKNYQKKDDRINLLTQNNQGVTKSLNKGIRNCRGKYVARMDADDICAPKRFELQLEYLEKYPNTDIVGCMVSLISEKGKVIRSLDDLPLEDYQIKWNLIFGTPLIHPTLMIRRRVFEDIGHYDQSLNVAQDIEFWRRLSHHIKFYNIPQRLFDLRIHKESTSSLFRNEQESIRNKSLVQYVNTITGMNYKISDIHLLIKLLKNGINTFSQFRFLTDILNHLRRAFINTKCQSKFERKYIDKNLSSLFLQSAFKAERSNFIISIFMVLSSVLFDYKMIFKKKTWWYMKQGFIQTIPVKAN